jgi:triosephosphate isomerase
LGLDKLLAQARNLQEASMALSSAPQVTKDQLIKDNLPPPQALSSAKDPLMPEAEPPKAASLPGQHPVPGKNASSGNPDFIVIGNWKMYGTSQQVEAFFAACAPVPPGVRAVICPPFVYLAQAHQCLKNKLAQSLSAQIKADPSKNGQDGDDAGYGLGAQTCSQHKDAGPWTGQIQAAMLADVGCRFVIIGHPERQSWETPAVLAKQIQAALGAGLQPVICLTDPTQIQRIQAALHAHCPHQSGHKGDDAPPTSHLAADCPAVFDSLHDSFQDNLQNILKDCWLAFEPAVGAPFPPPQAIEDLKSIRAQWPHQTLLYGGGISPETLGLVRPFVDGVLVGRASLTPHSWNALLMACADGQSGAA